MKKLLAIVALIGLLAVPAFAGDAVDKGTLWITGEVSVTTQLDPDEGTEITLDAIGNYFVIDNLAVGGELGVTSESDGDTTEYNIGVNVLYAFDLDKAIYPFVTATVGYMGVSDGGSDSWMYVKAGGGMNWAVKDNIGVRADLLYNWEDTEGKATSYLTLLAGFVGIFDL